MQAFQSLVVFVTRTCLALLDSRVSSSTKRLMVSAMHNEEDPQDQWIIPSKSLLLFEDFITPKSVTLLGMMELPDGSLKIDPDM